MDGILIWCQVQRINWWLIWQWCLNDGLEWKFFKNQRKFIKNSYAKKLWRFPKSNPDNIFPLLFNPLLSHDWIYFRSNWTRIESESSPKCNLHSWIFLNARLIPTISFLCLSHFACKFNLVETNIFFIPVMMKKDILKKIARSAFVC